MKQPISNLSLIQEFYHLFKNKDKKFLDFCHDDVEWITADEMPDGGTFNGKKQIFEEYFPKMLSNFREFHAISEQFFDFKDHIMVVGRYQGKSKSDKTFDIPFSHVYLIQDGKIIQFRQFTDAQSLSSSI